MNTEKFVHYEVTAGPENIVQIKLDRRANVRFMDAVNFNKYKLGKEYEFDGGLALESPVEFRPEYRRKWHVCVDMRGLKGEVKVALKVLSC